MLCLDEKPAIQVLERLVPRQPMAAGRIERQEFEDKRHGTVNLLVSLRLADGTMWSECPEKNDSDHFQAAVGRLINNFPKARRITLIMDNGSSHTSRSTLGWLANQWPRVQVLFTPARASWLNQAELLLRSFSHRFLRLYTGLCG